MSGGLRPFSGITLLILPFDVGSYRVADFFVQLPLDEAKERIASAQKVITEEVAKMEGDIEQIDVRMSKLKVLLYGRFGKVGFWVDLCCSIG